ncbi:MAG TPA: cobalamin-binding protein [Firmicutes bacterium]|nr:cobalamin-binding protein [Bacillota bacterium]
MSMILKTRSCSLYRALGILLLVILMFVLVPGGAWSLDEHAQAFPVTIKDSTGNTVVIPSLPRRIISIAPSNTEILYALGAGDRVIGVTTACDYPPEARQKEKVGDVNLNFEKIVSMRPDVVLGVASLQGAAIERLRRLGIPVVAVDPKTVDEVLGAIELVGRVVGADRERVQSLIKALVGRKERVLAATSRIPETARPRVFVEIWHEPLMTAGPGTFVDEIIQLAGGKNIAFDSGNPWPQFSEELLIERDPEIIVLTCHNLEQVMSEASWQGISAVKNRRVYEIDPDILVRPGPRLIDGLEVMARYIRPLIAVGR